MLRLTCTRDAAIVLCSSAYALLVDLKTFMSKKWLIAHCGGGPCLTQDLSHALWHGRLTHTLTNPPFKGKSSNKVVKDSGCNPPAKIFSCRSRRGLVGRQPIKRMRCCKSLVQMQMHWWVSLGCRATWIMNDGDCTSGGERSTLVGLTLAGQLTNALHSGTSAVCGVYIFIVVVYVQMI